MFIALDAGHGGDDWGAEFKGVRESDINLDICRLIKPELERLGHTVEMTRLNDTDVSLPRRVAIANKKADIFVSIHCNADPDDDSDPNFQAKGEEIWIYQNSVGGLKLANDLKDAVDSIFPGNDFRGIKGTKKLYVLRKTKMPAVLIELGFIDNRAENLELSNKESQIIIAGVLAKAIHNHKV